MSQENVEIVRRIWEANERRDWEAISALYARDIEWEDTSGLWGDWGTARGPEGIREAWRRWFEAFERVTIDFGDAAAAGNDVVVTYRLSGRGRGSGVDVTQEVTLVWTLREEKVVQVRAYRDRASALEAAELSE